MAFLDLVAELSGVLPGLSPLLAETYINRAWRDVRDSSLWSFLVADTAFIAPAAVTAGTFSITQFTATVTANGTASTALLALGSTPGLTNLQIRFGQTAPATGQIYNILSVDSTNPAAIILTLDRPVQEPTDGASTYRVYRCYITPPADDFLSWLAMTDLVQGWKLFSNLTSAQLDLRDPRRSLTGPAMYYVSYRGNTILDPVTGTVTPNAGADAGTQLYELWPHPTAGQRLYARYRRAGNNFAQPTDTQPVLIPDQLIVTRAVYKYGYPYAQSNEGNFPTFKGANWAQLISDAKGEYDQLLSVARSRDSDQALQAPY
jgi:hypothetical protein